MGAGIPWQQAPDTSCKAWTPDTSLPKPLVTKCTKGTKKKKKNTEWKSTGCFFHVLSIFRSLSLPSFIKIYPCHTSRMSSVLIPFPQHPPPHHHQCHFFFSTFFFFSPSTVRWYHTDKTANSWTHTAVPHQPAVTFTCTIMWLIELKWSRRKWRGIISNVTPRLHHDVPCSWLKKGGSKGG